jgi:pSer/pThr/pTyr-binding forkhead associated (FHA) protein
MLVRKRSTKFGVEGQEEILTGVQRVAKSDEEHGGFTTTVEMVRSYLTQTFPVRERAYLQILSPLEKMRFIELRESDVLIGRSPGCDVQFVVENVSRKHARVFFYNEEFMIEDLDSTNGLFVNGIKIVRCALRNNDQIALGGVRLLFNEEKSLQPR